MKANSYIPALTGVRAIAAFFVFFHHYNQLDFSYPIQRTLNEFHMGVTMFFVLSGFLICMRYYGNSEITGSWFRKYIKNRIARIYPMYLFLTLLTFLLYFLIGGEASVIGTVQSPILILFLNIFFIRGFFDDLKFTGVGQGWSLTVEECFYLLAPVLFIGIKRNKNNLIYYPLLLLVFGITMVLVFLNFSVFGFFKNFQFLFLYTFFGRCVEFFIGMKLALIVLEKKEKILSRPVFTTMGVLGMVIAVSVLVFLPLNGREFGLYHPFGIFTNNIILPIAIAVLYYGLIIEKSWLQKFLSSATMQLLGKSSYIFYLIHIGVFATFLKNISRNTIDLLFNWFDNHGLEWVPEKLNDSILYIALVFVLLNLVSIVLYKLMEEPLNLAIRKSSFLEKKINPIIG
ncbi:MAG: acyltransferase [Bacteroidetes bacterium]|nr:acyltransferase [Bacteroidota bacterium]